MLTTTFPLKHSVDKNDALLCLHLMQAQLYGSDPSQVSAREGRVRSHVGEGGERAAAVRGRARCVRLAFVIHGITRLLVFSPRCHLRRARSLLLLICYGPSVLPAWLVRRDSPLLSPLQHQRPRTRPFDTIASPFDLLPSSGST